MNTWIDPELEARVVAWVAGEASAFEIAELERLIAEKPELGIFKRRIEAVQGLVGEAVRPDAEPLRLAPERRAKLLQAIGAEAEPPVAAAAGPVGVFQDPHGKRRKYFRGMTIAAAACVPLAVLLFVSTKVSFHASRPRPEPALARAPAKKAEPTYEFSAFEVRDESRARRLLNGATERVIDVFRDREDKPKGERAAPAETMNVKLASPPPPPGDAGRVFARVPVTVAPAAPTARAGNKPDGDTSDLAKSLEVQAPTEARTILAQSRTGAPGITPLPPASEPVVKLDAFVVSESRESGYAASTSMSSARVAANSVSVLPPPELRLGADVIVPLPDKNAGPVETKEMPATQSSPPAAAGYVTLDMAAIANGQPVTFGQSAGTGAVIGGLGGVSVGGTVSTTATTRASDTAASNEAVRLEAFSVSADKDRGYQARANQAADDRKIAAKRSAPTRPKSEVPLPAARASLIEADAPASKAKPATPPHIPSVEETNSAKDSVSTFSLHVSDVSFRLAQAALARGEAPDATRIRPEEIYNAFDYGDPSPSPAEKIACRIEQAAHPFLQQRNLVRIAMKVAATGRGATTPLRLTVLLDTSGSMEREDRVAAVRSAMTALVSLLGPYDRITLIGFSRQPRLLAEAVVGNQASSILDLMQSTPAEGGTNLEEALKIGSQLARRHQLAGAQNRIVLLTDGAANLGNANPAQLAATIETLRQQGIAFDACGVGLDGLDDAMLEALTRKGDGRYYALGAGDATDGGFARQLAGAFRPAAENVKVQVRFNPARVGQYRLIGFEQHRLRTEDFRNDQVDAAELAAEEAAVALYQVEVLPQGAGELGEVFVRFREPASGAMVERSWTMAFEATAPAFDRATPSLQLAGTAALVAEKLRESPLADQFKLGDLARTVNL
ncbi:MAG TPA: von Willebrand factor type A domain-containing protein, partial [Opitutaceae bacterium]|nr:von Willebrand factor type A domain-containing protein [Opitutaceae bacterium]